jgi:PAS domain S-box-containing protein
VALASSKTDAFSDRHRTLLAVVSCIAGIAYENILYTQTIQELAEDRYRRLVESANDGIAFMDADGRFTYVNRVLLEILGYGEDEILGKEFWQFMSPGSLDLSMKVFWEGKKGKDARNVELNVDRKNGTSNPFEGNIVPLFEEGRFVGGFAILRDITQRKQAEEALRKSERQIRETQRIEAIGRLAGGVAHDFNNLLTLIIGHCDLAVSGLPEDAAARVDIDAIRKAGERAASLTARLLAFSRKQTLRLNVLDLNTVLRDTASMLRRLIGEDVSLEMAYAAERRRVLADPTHIGQVIMNLAVNARDAMPGGGRLKISAQAVDLDEAYCAANPEAHPGQHVCVSVEDDGVGMDGTTLKRIFEPFFTTKRPGEGTGLGLSMVYGTIKQHRGWVDVKSAPGEGSTFKFFLPVLPEDEAVEDPGRALPDKEPGGGERVLVVEDELALREFAARVLVANGYKVLTARNVQEAMEIFGREEGAFHLVFSDVVLPDGSGVDLVGDIMEHRPGIRVLLSSGYADERSQRKLIEQMNLPFLRKPYGVDELLRAVRDAVEKTRR